MDGKFKNTGLARCVVIAVAGAVGLLACAAIGRAEDPAAPARDRNPVPADHRSIAKGRAVYARHCSSCHGPSGRGDGSAGRDLDPPPTNLAGSEVSRQSDAELFRKITRGRRPMPSFRRLLNDEDRWHVVNFIRTFGDRTAAAEVRR